MDFETIKNNAVNAFHQLSVLRVIVTSPNEKVADVPALYALAALLLAPWVCAAALVLGFLFKYGIRFEKRRGEDELSNERFPSRRRRVTFGVFHRLNPPQAATIENVPQKEENFEPEYTHINTNRDEPFMVRPGFFFS